MERYRENRKFTYRWTENNFKGILSAIRYRVTIAQAEIRYTLNVIFHKWLWDALSTIISFKCVWEIQKKMHKTPYRQHLTFQSKCKKSIIHIFYFQLVSFYNEIFKFVWLHNWKSIKVMMQVPYADSSTVITWAFTRSLICREKEGWTWGLSWWFIRFWFLKEL